MADNDLTTLGVKYGYAVETEAGKKPAAFKQLERCREISGISLSQEKIDLSCLEDSVKRYGKGQQDTGGDWSAKFLTGAITEVKAMMAAAATGAKAGLNTWFEVYVPNMTDAWFIVAQPGDVLPLPDIGTNSALEMQVALTIQEYKGLDVAIEPTKT